MYVHVAILCNPLFMHSHIVLYRYTGFIFGVITLHPWPGRLCKVIHTLYTSLATSSPPYSWALISSSSSSSSCTPIFTLWWSSCSEWGIVVSVVFLDFVKHFLFIFFNSFVTYNRKNTVELLRKSPHLFMWLEHLISLNREKKPQTWTIFNFCHIRCCLSISPVCQRVDTISVVCWVFPLFMPSTWENAHHIICLSLFYEYIVTFNFSWKIYMWTLFFSLEGYFH